MRKMPMTKQINKKNVLIVKASYWDQIYNQIKNWLDQNNIKVLSLLVPPNYDTVAVRFASDEELMAFKIVWGGKLHVKE